MKAVLKSLAVLQLTIAIVGVAGLSSCGSSSSQNTQPMTVSVSSSAKSLAAGQTATLTATTNDPKGVTWSVSGGGALSGQTATSVTYTAPATVSSAFTATITGTSASEPSVSGKCGIAVSFSSLAVLTTSLPKGVVSLAYSQTPQVTGGVQPYTFSVPSGTLPVGVTLNSSTGEISGFPIFFGNYPFIYQVTDSASPPNVAPQNLTMTVSQTATLTVLMDVIADGAVSASYNQTPPISGGMQPYTFSISSGSLPPGLSLGSTTGAVTGTPTTAGTYYFTYKVTDSDNPAQIATQNMSVTVGPAGTLTVGAIPNSGVVGTFYGAAPAVSGGNPPYSASITSGSLPPGFLLEQSAGGAYPIGTIYGTSNTVGTYNFTYQVIDSSYLPQVANANFSITINPVSSSFNVLSGSLPTGEVGLGYNSFVSASGGAQPYTFSLASGALPPGLMLNTPAPGSISGNPTTAGDYNFTIQVTDFSIPPNVANANLSITIAPPVTIATTSLPNASVGTVYVAPPIQVTGGVPPYSLFSSSPFFNSLNGVISFVPTTTGIQSFSVSAGDKLGGSASGTLNVNVDPANCPNNANFQGNYAMLLNAPVSTVGRLSVVTPVLLVGSFVADGAGNISQGYMDDGYSTTGVGLGGDYCIGANNVGTMVYPAGGPAYLIQLDSSGNADAVVYQNPPPGSTPSSWPIFGAGTLAKQDTTAFSTSEFVGQYSFGWSGGNGYVDEFQDATFASDGAGNLTAGQLDRQGSGNPYNTTFTATDFVVGPSGRGTVTLNELSEGTVPVRFYVVNAAQLFAVAAPVYPTTFVAGPVVQTSGGPYTNGSLNGVSVFVLQGQSSVPRLPAQSEIGLIAWDGAGNFTLSADENVGGTLTTVNYGGTYSVESNGRVTLVSSGESAPPIFYLTGANQGFIISAGWNFANGQFFAQSAGTFGNSSFSGTYLGRQVNTSVTNQLDYTYCCTPAFQTELDNLSADGIGTLTGTTYLDDQWLGPSSVAVSSTYTVDSSGRGVVSVGGNQTEIFYVVSPTQVLMTSSSIQYPKVMNLTHP